MIMITMVTSSMSMASQKNLEGLVVPEPCSSVAPCATATAAEARRAILESICGQEVTLLGLVCATLITPSPPPPASDCRLHDGRELYGIMMISLSLDAAAARRFGRGCYHQQISNSPMYHFCSHPGAHLIPPSHLRAPLCLHPKLPSLSFFFTLVKLMLNVTSQTSRCTRHMTHHKSPAPSREYTANHYLLSAVCCLWPAA